MAGFRGEAGGVEVPDWMNVRTESRLLEIHLCS